MSYLSLHNVYLYLRRLCYRLLAGTNRDRMQPLLELWSQSPTLRKQPQNYLVVDCETTALKASKGELLSIGWVPIDQGVIKLAEAEHLLIRPQGSVGQSAVYHALKDNDLAEGLSPAHALQRLLKMALGRVLVFHYAQLDLAFINQLCLQEYGAPLLMLHQDTFVIEQQRLERKQGHLNLEDLRLPHCRERYGLPEYPMHNATLDALATAELFLAQQAR